MEKQSKQKTSFDKKAKSREFTVGNLVYVRNHAQGDKWLLRHTLGPVSLRFTCKMDELYAAIKIS